MHCIDLNLKADQSSPFLLNLLHLHTRHLGCPVWMSLLLLLTCQRCVQTKLPGWYIYTTQYIAIADQEKTSQPVWGFPACSLLPPTPRIQYHPAPQLRLSKPSRDDNYSIKCSIFTFGQYFEKRKSAPFPNICDAMVAGKWCLPTFDKKRVPGQRCRSKRRPCCAILLQLCKVHTTTNWLGLSGARFVQLWGCADANGATQDLYSLSAESSLAFLQTRRSDQTIADLWSSTKRASTSVKKDFN